MVLNPEKGHLRCIGKEIGDAEKTYLQKSSWKTKRSVKIESLYFDKEKKVLL